MISAFSQNETPASFHGAVNGIEIQFGAGRAYPWIEFKRDQRGFNGLTNEPDRVCAFGSASLLHRVQTASIVSESKVSNGVLLEIAQLLRKDANSIAGYIEYLKEAHQEEGTTKLKYSSPDNRGRVPRATLAGSGPGQ